MSATWAALCLVAGGFVFGCLCTHWWHRRRSHRASDKKVQPITYAKSRRDWGGGKSA